LCWLDKCWPSAHFALVYFQKGSRALPWPVSDCHLPVPGIAGTPHHTWLLCGFWTTPTALVDLCSSLRTFLSEDWDLGMGVDVQSSSCFSLSTVLFLQESV
jgi:hypothetical protein